MSNLETSTPGKLTRTSFPTAFQAEWGARSARLFAAMLDEIDFGMLLAASDGRVQHINLAARRELDSDHPLLLARDRLRARDLRDTQALERAMLSACRHDLRCMVTLGQGAKLLTVAVVPLTRSTSTEEAFALLMLGKRRVCADLSVESFARAMALTTAETAVLKALCRGELPNEIAFRHGVAVSTIRTQVGQVRAKTGAVSIGALVRQVAVLPPIVNVLRV